MIKTIWNTKRNRGRRKNQRRKKKEIIHNPISTSFKNLQEHLHNFIIDKTKHKEIEISIFLPLFFFFAGSTFNLSITARLTWWEIYEQYTEVKTCLSTGLNFQLEVHAIIRFNWLEEDDVPTRLEWLLISRCPIHFLFFPFFFSLTQSHPRFKTCKLFDQSIGRTISSRFTLKPFQACKSYTTRPMFFCSFILETNVQWIVINRYQVKIIHFLKYLNR